MEYIAIGSSLVAILTFVFGAFHYVVLKPLKESIVDLKGLIDKIQYNIEENEKVRHELEVRMATFEEKLHSLESNYDSVTKYCMDKLYGHG